MIKWREKYDYGSTPVARSTANIVRAYLHDTYGNGALEDIASKVENITQLLIWLSEILTEDQQRALVAKLGTVEEIKE